MRTLISLLLLLVAVVSVAQAEGDQAYLALLAETKVTKMVGMEMPALPPGMDLSALPPEAAAMFGGGAQRVLNVRLWSPSLAPADAFATITPPAGLKQGNKLDLDLYRPKPEQTTAESGASGDSAYNPDKIEGFTIKIYWGSSETVKPGQPKIIRWDGLSGDQKEAMKKQAREAQNAGSYFYKPNWTTGYWPTKKQPGKIAKDASLVGNYQLTTNYTGNVAIEAPSNVNFLDPFDITSPSLKKEIPLDKAINFAWKQIPNALGLHASIIGMEGKNTLVMWTSSEVYTDAAMFSDMGFLQMAEVREFVKQTIMMKGDTTKVSVPAGIFEKCSMPMMQMVGYGPGAALDKAQPLPRIQTKTSMNLMLGGPGMGNMGGMGDDSEDDQ